MKVKDCSLKSKRIASCLTLTYSKEFKISTKIKYIELALIFPINQSRTKPCTTTYHLPKLSIAHYFFKKYQIQYFRYIDTGIQHIHGDCNLWHLINLGKGINQALRIVDSVINDLRKIIQIGIIFIKDFQNLFRMIMVFCKDYGLSNLLPIVNFYPFRHKDMENLSNGIFIENPRI